MSPSQPRHRRPRLSRLSSVVLAFLALAASAPGGHATEDPILTAAKRVEAELGMRVGYAIVETDSGTINSYRADERFAMASTFKALACGAALKAGSPVLDRKTTITKSDLRSHSPVTEKRVGASLSTRSLCEITLRTSDNAAANLILKSLGGPSRVTAFLREVGDGTTRLDRTEPEVNQATPGDPRDTTTPRAISATLHRLLLGDALAPDGRDQLEAWMRATAVADGLLRSTLPQGWQIADRGGAGGHGTRGIIALVRPPQAAPLVIAIYMDGRKHDLKTRDAAIAAIGRAIFEEYGR